MALQLVKVRTKSGCCCLWAVSGNYGTTDHLIIHVHEWSLKCSYHVRFVVEGRDPARHALVTHSRNLVYVDPLAVALSEAFS